MLFTVNIDLKICGKKSPKAQLSEDIMENTLPSSCFGTHIEIMALRAVSE